MRLLVFTAVVISILLLVGVAIFVGLRMYRQRKRALAAQAKHLGLQFCSGGDRHAYKCRDRFACLRGRGQVENVMSGAQQNAKVMIFDYCHLEDDGDGQRRTSQTMMVFEADDLRLPAFQLRPAGILDAIGNILGFRDINFETHEKFSRVYVLRSEKEDRTREFFDDAILDFFSIRDPIAVEARRGVFIYYRPGITVDAGDVPDFLQRGSEVLDAFRARLARSDS